MKIFSGSSSQVLAGKIAEELHASVSSVERFVFPDGEQRLQVQENVVEQQCILVHSTSTPVDQNYIETFLLLDALKRSGAATITMVMPYMGYQRQDHIFRDGEAVSVEAMITILASLKIDTFVSVDAHSTRIPDLFPSRITVSHLSALPLFAQKIKEEGWDTDATVLVSPDMGGINRIKRLSELLNGMSYAATEKNRDLETGALEEHTLGEGNVKGKKRAIIVDDMIASGGTIADAARLLVKLGVEELYAFATHAVFAGNVKEILENSPVKKIYVTNSIEVLKENYFDMLEILSIAKIIGNELKRY